MSIVGHGLTLAALATAVAGALMLGLWLRAVRTANAAIVDVGWALSFTLVIVAFAAAARTPATTWAPLALGVVAWSLRLGLHLARRVLGKPEEGRYRELRRRWSPRADRAFFVFFQAQALLVGVLSLAIVWPFVTAPHAGAAADAARLAGLGLIALGVAGEALADAQLAAFLRDPAHRGRVCDVGLWGWSRHPNYFFEIVVWVGFAVHAAAYPWGWIAALGPVVIASSILLVTGIPATEAQSLRSKGDAYRAYQARTSALVPWPPSPPRSGS